MDTKLQAGTLAARRAMSAVSQEEKSRRGLRCLPLPLGAVLLVAPFLVAWSSAQREDPSGARVIQGAHAEARPLDEPFAYLGRDSRLPAVDGGYVDVWAVPVGWEADLLHRRGYTTR